MKDNTERFYYLSAFGEIESVENNKANAMVIRDLSHWGNCFATEDSAIRALKKVKLALSNDD